MPKASSEKTVQRLPAAKAFRLADLLDYAKDAVVSRTLVQDRAGTVTLFAFDRGQGLSEHTAPFDALVQVVAGSARLTIGGRAVTAGPGQVVRMPAGVPHAVDAVRRFKMLLTLIRGSR